MDVYFKDVALSAGMNELQYGSVLFDYLAKGDIINLLNLEGQADICDWINDNSLLNGKPFCLEIHISINQYYKIVLYALCRMNLMGDEPKCLVSKNVMNSSCIKPKEFDNIPFYAITLPMMLKCECPKED